MALDKKRNASSVAAKLKISQPSVSGWLNRDARPEHHMRIALENATDGDVKAAWWLTRKEARFAKSVTPMAPTGTEEG